MAKKSVIQRNIKRKKLVNRYAKKRAALKLLCKDPTISAEERFNNFMKLLSFFILYSKKICAITNSLLHSVSRIPQ